MQISLCFFLYGRQSIYMQIYLSTIKHADADFSMQFALYLYSKWQTLYNVHTQYIHANLLELNLHLQISLYLHSIWQTHYIHINLPNYSRTYKVKFLYVLYIYILYCRLYIQCTYKILTCKSTYLQLNMQMQIFLCICSIFEF